jgi:hypothetical protein
LFLQQFGIRRRIPKLLNLNLSQVLECVVESFPFRSRYHRVSSLTRSVQKGFLQLAKPDPQVQRAAKTWELTFALTLIEG